MDELLKQLVFQVQQYPRETEERQQALRELVAQILRSRPICRPRSSQPLAGIYLDIFQAVQQQLQHDVDQTIDCYNPQRTPARDWANGLRDAAFKQVLNSDRLTLLALEAQRHNAQTQQGQYALRELLNAIRLSGKLSRPSHSLADVYEDAVTRTLLWVCQNLNAYSPSRGKLMAWVNYRLDMILRDVRQESKDPLIQSIEGKIIREKYQLKSIIKKAEKPEIKFLLMLRVKGLIPDSSLSLNVILILTVLLFLAQLFAYNQDLGDSLLFEMSKKSFPLPSELHEITGESNTIDHIAQAEEKPFLSDLVRHYIEEDPAKLFQKHIKEHPQATFQAIALARLDGKPWQEISESWGIGISTLNNFFKRYLREVAPEIRKYIQE